VDWFLDHVVNVVTDLDSTVDRYTKAGFTVVRGGKHAGVPVENALIGLPDGSYIELFTFTDASQPQPNHPNWAVYAQGGGLATFWFGTNALEDGIAKVRAQGVPLEDARGGSRVRPDGYEVKFRLAVPKKADYPHIPALITDVTPRAERLPPPAKHANGIQGICAVAVRVPDVAKATAFYEGLGGRAQGGEVAFCGKRLSFTRASDRFGIESFGFVDADGKEIAHARLVGAA
jgi:catechol 2,3-dioxygenase-like lactoylglutathione lyase family enzyme